MIPQSVLSPTNVPFEKPIAQAQIPQKSQWKGVWVTALSGVTSFMQSLHPSYVPSHMQPLGPLVEFPSFNLDAGDPSRQPGTFFSGTRLAARLVSAYAQLPDEVCTVIRNVADLTAVFEHFSNNKPQQKPSNAAACSITAHSEKENPIVTADTKKKAKQKSNKTTTRPATGTSNSRQLPKMAVALGAASSLTAAAAAPAPGSASEHIIEVADEETLSKIGRDPRYPLNGIYYQSADFVPQLDKPIGNRTHPFTGQYDGLCHTIENFTLGYEGCGCLFKKLGSGSIVSNLRFTNGWTMSTLSGEPGAIVACEISEGAVVNNILAVKSVVESMNPLESMNPHWGISEAHVGIIGGKVSGTVSNIVAIDCYADTFAANTYVGIGAGLVSGGRVENILAINSHVRIAEGSNSAAGIGAGGIEKGAVVNTTVVNCTFRIDSPFAPNAAFGVGAGVVIEGTVANTTAVNCKVAALTGYPSLDGQAGIGGGYIRGREAKVINTIAVNCSVDADPEVIASQGWAQSSAGIGAGKVIDVGTDSICDTKVINSTIDAQFAGIHGGSLPYVCNTSVNGIKQNDTVDNCVHSINNFCQDSAPLVLTPDCKIRNPQHVDNLIKQNFCPAMPFPAPTTPLTPSTPFLSTAAVIGISLAAGAVLLAGGIGGLYLYGRYYHSGEPEPDLNSNSNDENQPLLA